MSEKVYTVDEIKRILESLLKEKPVYKVILFGSYAKNVATKKSDLDFVIDTKSTLRGFKLIGLICELQEAFQKEIDGFEQYEIEENSTIDKEIKETGVVVYEK